MAKSTWLASRLPNTKSTAARRSARRRVPGWKRRSNTRPRAEDTDELTFEYAILVDVGPTVKQLLTGTVTYINIPKGREHFAVMYIPPRTLEKLAGNKPPGSNIIGGWVTVSHQGQILDQAGYKLTAKPNFPQIANSILNKNETPFAPLFYDRYETIKATR
ncbi:MAG: Amuc_1102 family pilus-like protein [Chthoniobacter sp.]